MRFIYLIGIVLLFTGCSESNQVVATRQDILDVALESVFYEQSCIQLLQKYKHMTRDEAEALVEHACKKFRESPKVQRDYYKRFQ